MSSTQPGPFYSIPFLFTRVDMDFFSSCDRLAARMQDANLFCLLRSWSLMSQGQLQAVLKSKSSFLIRCVCLTRILLIRSTRTILKKSLASVGCYRKSTKSSNRRGAWEASSGHRERCSRRIETSFRMGNRANEIIAVINYVQKNATKHGLGGNDPPQTATKVKQ